MQNWQKMSQKWDIWDIFLPFLHKVRAAAGAARRRPGRWKYYCTTNSIKKVSVICSTFRRTLGNVVERAPLKGCFCHF